MHYLICKECRTVGMGDRFKGRMISYNMSFNGKGMVEDIPQAFQGFSSSPKFIDDVKVS
jgi:hypothetical protein